MKIILSIKPQFANKIFDGEKEFEFRRILFKRKDVKEILVYASSPISKVIGQFEVADILNKELNQLWEITSHKSGISKDYYLSYFLGAKKCYAIKIKNPQKYKRPLCIHKRFGLHPPQSFVYIN